MPVIFFAMGTMPPDAGRVRTGVTMAAGCLAAGLVVGAIHGRFLVRILAPVLQRKHHMPVLVAALILAVASPALAQWPAPYFSPSLRPEPLQHPRELAPAPPGPRSTGRLIVGGLLGATAGLGLGILGYTALDRQDPCLASDCDSRLGTGLVAATVGLTLGTPLGVHLANSRRGSVMTDLLVSAGVAGLGWAGAALVDDARWLLVIPPGQIAAAVLSERHTSR